MNSEHLNQSQLWSMLPHVFNEWRAVNDLPLLFEYLKEILPKFGDWLDTLPFGMDVTMRIVPTGDIFKGDKNKVVFKRDGGITGTTVIECYEGSPDDAKEWGKTSSRKVQVFGEIEPYFKWAKRTLGRKRFFIWDAVNKQKSDKFLYGSWSGLNVDNCVTQAHLFRSFRVLKLGQITLDRTIAIGTRNLDFCDLDYLTITNGWHGYGSNWKTINYSSCREISFINADVTFYTFYSCAIPKLIITNSKFQDLYFENTDMNELRLTDSFIFRMGFNESNITPFIQNCELREVLYHPKKGSSPSGIATTYRLFRNAYQSNGLRQEASECYYNERVYERKAYFHPCEMDRKNFPGISHGGRFSVVIDLYEKGFFEIANLPLEFWKVCVSKIKMHTLPKYLLPLLKSRFRWLTSIIECLLWGYGERPSRVLLVALVLICFYALSYNLAEWEDDKGQPFQMSFWDSVYFSVVTFTTLGYGDFTPKTGC